MTERSILYTAGTTEFYLPPLSDKSLTLRKLEQLAAFETVSLPLSMVDELPLKTHRTAEEVRQALIGLNAGDKPFWFAIGRLPHKSYLLNCLNALKPDHPLIGLSHKPLGRRRIFVVNENCSHCLRCYRSEMRRQALLRYNPPPYKHKQAQPVGIDRNSNLAQQWRQILRSRHNVVALGRTNSALLSEAGGNDINLQVSIQMKVSHIDRLMDTIASLD